MAKAVGKTSFNTSSNFLSISLFIVSIESYILSFSSISGFSFSIFSLRDFISSSSSVILLFIVSFISLVLDRSSSFDKDCKVEYISFILLTTGIIASMSRSDLLPKSLPRIFPIEIMYLYFISKI